MIDSNYDEERMKQAIRQRSTELSEKLKPVDMNDLHDTAAFVFCLGTALVRVALSTNQIKATDNEIAQNYDRMIETLKKDIDKLSRSHTERN